MSTRTTSGAEVVPAAGSQCVRRGLPGGVCRPEPTPPGSRTSPSFRSVGTLRRVRNCAWHQWGTRICPSSQQAYMPSRRSRRRQDQSSPRRAPGVHHADNGWTGWKDSRPMTGAVVPFGMSGEHSSRIGSRSGPRADGVDVQVSAARSRKGPDIARSWSEEPSRVARVANGGGPPLVVDVPTPRPGTEGSRRAPPSCAWRRPPIGPLNPEASNRDTASAELLVTAGSRKGPRGCPRPKIPALRAGETGSTSSTSCGIT